MSSDHRLRNVEALDRAAIQNLAIILCLFTIGISLGCGGASTSTVNTNGNGGSGGPVAASISGTIAVGTAPSAVAVDSTANKIYVADFGMQQSSFSMVCSPTGADVAVIDGATGSATAVPFNVQSGASLDNPIAIALNPASHTAYVVERGWGPDPFTGKGCAWISDVVRAVDTSTLAVTSIYNKLTLGRLGFLGIDVNQTTSDIYLSDEGTIFPLVANSIVVIGANAATIPVGTTPIGVSVNATTNKIYVANSGSNDISVIDAASNSVVTTITDPNAVAPLAIAVNPTTNTIYVANSQSNNITVIDGATDSVTSTIPVGTSPSGVAVDEQTNFIYVANAGDSQTGDPGSITVIDGKTNAATTLMDSKAKNPVAVAANPVTNKIYVANSSSKNVTVIDGAHE
jgi:YVTN family beta-propeller protein